MTDFQAIWDEAQKAATDAQDAFLAKHGMAASRLGIEVFGDSAFVLRLRTGRNIGIDSADYVRAWMRKYQPPKRDKARRRKSTEACVPA